jgi:hypothetical protein
MSLSVLSPVLNYHKNRRFLHFYLLSFLSLALPIPLSLYLLLFLPYLFLSQSVSSFHIKSHEFDDLRQGILKGEVSLYC